MRFSHRARVYNFQALHLLTFLFIGTLHWWKHCTGLDEAPNLREFPFTELRVTAAEGVVCMTVTIGAHFPPKQRLHFQTLCLLGFLFICTLHWCKHCTSLDVAPNLRKFPMTALCVIAAERVVCRSVPVGGLFAPTQTLLFQALHLHSFLFTCPCISANIIPG